MAILAIFFTLSILSFMSICPFLFLPPNSPPNLSRGFHEVFTRFLRAFLDQFLSWHSDTLALLKICFALSALSALSALFLSTLYCTCILLVLRLYCYLVLFVHLSFSPTSSSHSRENPDPISSHFLIHFPHSLFLFSSCPLSAWSPLSPLHSGLVLSSLA